ncbi:MAG TPA: hypothetical protein VM050_05085 [Patescibacteria group bacterium]|nr:hypothetical protein [Patescibacteria group bacterium]
MIDLEFRQWTLMYIGGVISMIANIYIVYTVVTTGDPTIEWAFWIFFGLTLALIAGGYYFEREEKKRLAEEDNEDDP